MSDMPERIWAWCYGETDGYPSDFGEWQQPEPTDREREDHPSYTEYIRRDAPDLVALVEASRAMRAFDAMPLVCKRPDVFELRVRRPLLLALAAYEALK